MLNKIDEMVALLTSGVPDTMEQLGKYFKVSDSVYMLPKPIITHLLLLTRWRLDFSNEEAMFGTIEATVNMVAKNRDLLDPTRKLKTITNTALALEHLTTLIAAIYRIEHGAVKVKVGEAYKDLSGDTELTMGKLRNAVVKAIDFETVGKVEGPLDEKSNLLLEYTYNYCNDKPYLRDSLSSPTDSRLNLIMAQLSDSPGLIHEVKRKLSLGGSKYYALRETQVEEAVNSAFDEATIKNISWTDFVRSVRDEADQLLIKGIPCV